ncbi:MAG: NAD(P)H-dependent oxidoreductase [Candidatus Marinimicrobia bacterium]|jgi:NAD(P)H-dependent FMN reductase|nr:NAD(P)H-dependent oxidoreductase [Candidatus Neomarinimicrobiota bacterium]MDD4960819.1 NAD(P)H-dependent oxidoreductase [Candidatus Neomarinimicrobiota bacterium]MDD5709631.1 NAD(P)H-dependent oxidoreductase [Candidatus Neomarinimicrobiota bacterium]MDX9777378.1 NAD(P)H-dependent oxidoreductase [bacterium]
MEKKQVLAFSGSNGSQSINQELVSSAAGLLIRCGVRLISLRNYTAPLYCMDIEKNEGFPESMLELNRLFNEYDAFLIALPEHNGSVTPVFKNTIDWLSRIEMPIFRNKPLCLLSASPGLRGGAHNREHISGLMPFWGGRVVSGCSIGKFPEKWDRDLHRARDEKTQNLLRETIRIFEKEICQ